MRHSGHVRKEVKKAVRHYEKEGKHLDHERSIEHRPRDRKEHGMVKKHGTDHLIRRNNEFNDNRMVKDNHQGGIKRVLLDKPERQNVEGHFGKMGEKRGSETHFERRGSIDPTRA